jgi:type IV pilus assembly protein PilP
MDGRDAMRVVVGLLASLLVGAGPALGAETKGGALGGPAVAIGAARAAAAVGAKHALETDTAAAEIGLESGAAVKSGSAGAPGVPAAGSGSVSGSDGPAAVRPVATGDAKPQLGPATAAQSEVAVDPRDQTAPATAPDGDSEAAETVEATSLYDPARHRDPFRGPNLVAPEGVARTPLERYQVGQLKLVGVIWETEAPRAMVEDSVGLGYIIRTGTAIGSSGGVVRRIEPRRVLIEERVADFYGEKQPREVVMELPEEDRSP